MCGAAPWLDFHAEKAQASTNSAYAPLQTIDCVRDVVNGSMANGNASSPISDPKFDSAKRR